MMRRLLIAACALTLFAVMSACTASPPEGQMECRTAEDCPEGWICADDDLCYSSPLDEDAGDEDAG